MPVEGCPQHGQGVTTAHLYGEARCVDGEFLNQSIPSQLSLESARCHPLAELLEAVSVGVCNGHMRMCHANEPLPFHRLVFKMRLLLVHK